MLKLSATSAISTSLNQAKASRKLPRVGVSGLLPDVVLGVGAAASIDVSGVFSGAESFALAPSSAALPAGLSLSASGRISGVSGSAFAGDVVIRGSNAGSHADAGFALTVVAAPAVLTAPSVAGVPEVGAAVSAVGGVWSDATSVSTVLLVGGVERPSPHVLLAAEDGLAVSVRDTATGPGGTASAQGAALAVRWPAPALDALDDIAAVAGSGPVLVQAAGRGLAGGLWSLTGAAFATVDQAGLIAIDTAAPGSAVLTLVYANSGGTAARSFAVAVEAVPVGGDAEGIDWSLSDAMSPTGDVLSLSINALPEAGTDITGIEYSLNDGPWVDLSNPEATWVADADGVEFAVMSESETVTFTITEPADYAGTYLVPLADFLAGPVNIVPASVVASGGTYAVRQGLWAFPEADAALFTFAWRSGPVLWTGADGVSEDGLSFTPDDAAGKRIALSGLEFVEYAENAASGGPVSKSVTVVAEPVLEAVRYSPARAGAVRAVSKIGTAPNGDNRKLSYLFRVRPRDLSVHQAMLSFRFRSQFFLRHTTRSVRVQQRYGSGVAWLDVQSANDVVALDQWYSIWVSCDMDGGLSGGRSMVCVVNGTVAAASTVTLPDETGIRFSEQSWPSLFGAEATTFPQDTAPINVPDADFAPFVSIFHGRAPDPAIPDVWGEVFDPAAGHAVRPEYLDGSKTSIAGGTPEVILRGTGLLLGLNSAPGGAPWELWNGIQQEAVYA